MNISVEDLFPESFQRIKEEEANRPDPNWFAHLPPEKINAYMSKYPFKSFDDIPLDNSGLQYPVKAKIIGRYCLISLALTTLHYRNWSFIFPRRPWLLIAINFLRE